MAKFLQETPSSMPAISHQDFQEQKQTEYESQVYQNFESDFGSNIKDSPGI